MKMQKEIEDKIVEAWREVYDAHAFPFPEKEIRKIVKKCLKENLSPLREIIKFDPRVLNPPKKKIIGELASPEGEQK